MRKVLKGFVTITIFILIFGIVLAGCALQQDAQDYEEEKGHSNDGQVDEGVIDEKKDSVENLVEGRDYLVIDKPMKDFELEDLEGNIVKLSKWRGRVIFLNFWATWCPPCRSEMPHMQEIYEEYGDKEAVVVAVSSTSVELRGGTDSEKAKQQVKKFIESNKYNFPVLLDRDNRVLDDYSSIFPISGIPVTFIIDTDGIIRYVRVGAFEDKSQMVAFIKSLIAKK